MFRSLDKKMKIILLSVIVLYVILSSMLVFRTMENRSSEMQRQLSLQYTGQQHKNAQLFMKWMEEMAAIDFGQFAISNQPSFHIPYIYTVIGKPSRTQYWVRKAMKKLFSSRPDGLPGDEDNGSLSSWYIWSALGMYPFCPGTPEYVMGSPLFRKVTIQLENGKELVIEAVNNGAKNAYWDKLSVNGESWHKVSISHDQLAAGAKLQFHMVDAPAGSVTLSNSLSYLMKNEAAYEPV